VPISISADEGDDDDETQLWLTENAGDRVRSALRAFDEPAELHWLLGSDGPDVPRRRRFLQQQIANSDATLDALRKLKVAAKQGRSRLAFDSRAHRLLQGTEATASKLIERKVSQRRWFKERLPRGDNIGTQEGSRAASAKLVELSERLRAFEPNRWTVREIALLIRSSSEDWNEPPCPELARLDENVLIQRIEQYRSRARNLTG